MTHDHQHHRQSGGIKTAFFLNLGFTVFEFIGGFYVNSVAIMSDALHDLGDSLSIGLSWYLDEKSKQEATADFTFGYKRFSLLGALINSLVLNEVHSFDDILSARRAMKEVLKEYNFAHLTIEVELNEETCSLREV